MAELYGIPAPKVEGVWGEIYPLIHAACERGRIYHAEDIFAGLMERRMQLWVARREGKIIALAVTSISEMPRRKICELLIGTGTGREEWQHHRHTIEQWAKSQGCAAMYCLARKGWARVFNDYRMTHVLLEKELA